MIYQDVSPGEKVVNSAQRYNDINRLLNAVNGAGAGAILGGAGTVSRLKVYNSTSENLNFGWAVAFDNKAIVDGAVPAVKYSSNAKAWGVLTETLEPGSFGSVIISGAVEVAFSGSGDYASPDADGKSFVAGASGAQVLCSKDGRAVILLGGGVASETGYRGYFWIEDTSDETGFKVMCHKGWCDLTSDVYKKEFAITKDCSIYLLAEYIKDDETTGHYKVTLTDDWNRDRTSGEYATWLIGDIETTWKQSKITKIKVIQQWQSGAIYFGSRYWI